MNSNKRVLPTLIILLHFLCFSISQTEVEGLFIDRVSLSSSVEPTSNYIQDLSIAGIATPIQNYTVNWRTNLSQISKFGLSVHNFKLNDGGYQYLSFIAELQNVTLAKGDIYLNSNQTTQWIFCLTFHIIINTVQLNYLQFTPYSRNFSNLCNLSRVTRMDILTNQTVPVESDYEAFYFYSSKFMLGKPQIVVHVFIQWITYNTASDTSQQFNFTYWVNPTFGYTEIIFQQDLSIRNSFNSFKVNIIAIDCSAPATKLVYYYGNWQSSQPFPRNFYNPSSLQLQYGRPMVSWNCIYSFYAMQRPINLASYLLYVNSTLDIDITNASLNHPNQVYRQHSFCLVTCPSDTFIDYITNRSYCQPCIVGCLKCIDNLTCIECKPIAAFFNKKCIMCHLLIENCNTCLNSNQCNSCLSGRLVQGGCTKVAGCTFIVQVLYPHLHTVCYRCNLQMFSYNLTTQECDCITGWIVGDYCTTIIACTSTQLVSGAVVCTICDFTKHFYLKNGNCYCTLGYQLKDKTCVPICGDGLVRKQQCDDGNLIDGDGCSHDCKNEYYYNCTKDSLNPSLCSYFGKNLQINLTDTVKMLDQNTAVFTFKFSPPLLNLGKVDLKNYFVFSCQNARYSIQKWEFANGEAKLFVNFDTDLQTLNASVNFTFDYFYVKHTPIQKNFSMNGRNAKLTYVNRKGIQLFFQHLLFSLTIAALAMVFLCSWLQKMVGVQYLFLLQIVYYAHFGLLNYDPKFETFQYLGMAAFNYRSSTFSAINFQFEQSNQILEYSSETADYSALALTVLMAILIFLPLILKNFFWEMVQKYEAITKILKFNLVYTELISPITLSYSFPLFFIILTYSLNHEPLQVSAFRSAFLFLPISLYFLNINLVLQRGLLFPVVQEESSNYLVQNAKVSYLPLFQFSMISTIVVTWAWLRNNFENGLLALIGVIGAMLVLQLILRPYQSNLDNVGVDLNMAVALAFLVLAFLQNKEIIAFNSFNVDVFRYFFFAALTVCCVVSIVRLVRAFLQRGKPEIKLQEQKENKEEIDKDQIKERFIKSKNVKLQKSQSVIGKLKHQENIFGENKKQIDADYIKIVEAYRMQFRKKKLSIQVDNQRFSKLDG